MKHPSFRSQFDQLRQVSGYAEYNLDKGYEIVPAVHSSWKEAERRILFVVESMDSLDIHNGQMFSSSLDKRGNERNLMTTTMPNLLEQAWHLYQEYLDRNSLTDKPAAPDAVIGFVNFNAIKYFHLKDFQRVNALIDCGKRVQAIVERMKPTDIVIFGDTAASFTLPTSRDRQLLPYKRGWVEERTIGKHTCRVMNTLDIEPLYRENSDEDDDDDDGSDDASGPADLLYYVARHLCHAFAGKHLHSIGHFNPQYKLVDTIEAFDELFEKLVSWDKPIGFDTETKNLESVNNCFYTHQYAFTPKVGYVLPIEHPNTPFSAEEQAYIKKKLRKLWATQNPSRIKEFVGMNLAFDVRVVRAQFKIPVVYHRLWDVSAAETMLDENLAIMNNRSFRFGAENVKTPQHNLRQICTSYGSDKYWPKRMGGSGSDTFGKDNRATIGAINIMEKEGHDALIYCATDACLPLAVRRQQIEKARRIRISKTRTYEEVFERHVGNQMSNTVHAISHMLQNGSHIDIEYLQFLLTKESPLLKVKASTTKELMELPSTVEANAILLKGRKMQAKGLLGQAVKLFDIQKPDSLLALFFEVLKLKPLRKTATGQPSVDKKFLNEYAPTVREAELIADYRIAMKLHSTYVKGWLQKIEESIDSLKDKCLRPSFGFLLLTGRLNSFKPNLQQVPSRGSSASIIKQAFVPRKGRVNMTWDFNAAEVRKASVLSGDEGLAEAFLVGTRLRQQFIASFDENEKKDLLKRLKTEGDVHIANVKKFFGMWVDKNHPLRQAIKNVVFGALYGLSVKSLARDLENEAKYRHRAIILKLEKEIKQVNKSLREMADA